MVKGHIGQDQRSRSKVKGHMGQGQSKAIDIGRWAHINVKLHFLLSLSFIFIVIL